MSATPYCVKCARERGFKMKVDVGQFACSNCEEVCEEDGDLRYCPHEAADFCDVCFDDTHFTCCVCSESDCDSVQHEMVVIFDPEIVSGEGITAGVYKVMGTYFAQPIIGIGRIWGSAIERVADLPEDADSAGYPAGHLCRECQERITGD